MTDENVAETIVMPSEKAKMIFVAYRGILYAAYIVIAIFMLNGGAGAVVEWLVYLGINFIKMSTFGTMLVGMGMLVSILIIQYGIDRLFENQFGVLVNKKKEKIRK